MTATAGKPVAGTILVVDDDETSRRLCERLLEVEGYRVRHAADGEGCLAFLAAQPVDLVLLDIVMPGLDGYEVCQRIRQDPRTRHVPVVMITGQDDAQAKWQSLAVEASEFIAKPFDASELKIRVSNLLRVKSYQDELRRLNENLEQLVGARTRELADAHARLKVMNRMKSDFLAFISHELQTPLTYMSAVDLFDPRASPEHQAEVAEMIRSGYERLSSFIQKGLEYFKWLAVEGTQPLERMRLDEIVSSAARAVPGLRGPDARFELVLSGEPPAVRGNPGKLVEVVRVLLENAVKFSPGPKDVRVVVRSDGARALVAVTDRGRGFAPELAEALFEPFTVAHAQHHSKGTALNLALAKAIVEAHDGRLSAESPGPGQGATFTVELPVAPDARALP